ncbi:MAG: hypothetical protein ABFD16_25010 [Thermoguttaceae bacterium]|jgi:hypothetical protein
MSTTVLGSPRTKELSRQDLIEKYPDVSPFVILKIDVQRRQLSYTDRALATLDPKRHQVQINHVFGNTADAGRAIARFWVIWHNMVIAIWLI